jgi:predicted small secreted protein
MRKTIAALVLVAAMALSACDSGVKGSVNPNLGQDTTSTTD